MNNNSIFNSESNVNALHLNAINAEIQEYAQRIASMSCDDYSSEDMEDLLTNLQDLVAVKTLYLNICISIKEINDEFDEPYVSIPTSDFDITIHGARVDMVAVEDGNLSIYFGDPTDEDGEFEQLADITLSEFSTFGNELLACL